MSAQRKGDWIQTYTGRAFWPLDPRPEEVCLEDIAHALSNTCRFNGHVKRFYSVAEHSVIASYHVAPKNAMWALLHDAAEAYTSDIPRPLKRSMPGWKTMEGAVILAVMERFLLPSAEPADMRVVDDQMLATEAAQLVGPHPMPWAPLPDPLPIQLQCWMPSVAKQQFIQRYNELRGRGGITESVR